MALYHRKSARNKKGCAVTDKGERAVTNNNKKTMR